MFTDCGTGTNSVRNLCFGTIDTLLMKNFLQLCLSFFKRRKGYKTSLPLICTYRKLAQDWNQSWYPGIGILDMGAHQNGRLALLLFFITVKFL
jgi:hypothetical protein